MGLLAHRNNPKTFGTLTHPTILGIYLVYYVHFRMYLPNCNGVAEQFLDRLAGKN